MTAPRYVREVDRVGEGEAPLRLGDLDTTPILGTWRNANRTTQGIARVDVPERDGKVWVRAAAADPAAPGLLDWGEVAVTALLTDGPRSVRACGFTASYDLGFIETHLQANMAYGLMVIAAFNRFKDGSGRLDYFSREFFHKLEG